MATAYKTPGVYVKEISKFPPSVAAVATAIPAFIGYTEIAVNDNDEDLTNKPTRISSLLEYEQWFGFSQPQTGIVVTIRESQDAGGNTIEQNISASLPAASRSPYTMYYALQAYFDNGGGPCYIVSVGDYQTPGALSEGDLRLGLDALRNEDEPTLIVFPEQQNLPTADHLGLVNLALAQCFELQDRFVIADFHHTGEGLTTSGQVNTEATTFRNTAGSVSGHTRYGAVYFPNINTTFDYRHNDPDVTVVHQITAPDGTTSDGPQNGNTIDTLRTTQGALYTRIKSAVSALPVNIPPSGAVAGIYARVDEARGAWKAPANEGLTSVSGLTFKVTDEIQENLNVDTTAGKSINAIRAFTGRGILVWGARTLDGNSNEWRYVPVRRFFNLVEESTKKASGRFVFEPNDANTWVNVRAMIENFLSLQWKAGALAGAKREHAFYVRVGLGETMTALDILEGRMNVEIGMAVVRPAEFIILKFSHKMQES